MSTRALRPLSAVVASSVALLLAGCGGGDSEDSGASSNAAPASTPSKPIGQTKGPNGETAVPLTELKLTEDEVAKLKAGNHTAAFSWHQSSTFVSAVTRGAEDEFGRLGIDVVATANANFEAGKQRSDIESILARKPDALVGLPVDPVAAASAFKQVADQDVQVALLSNVPEGFKAGRDYTSVVTDDLVQMGQQAADALAAAMDRKGKLAYFFHDAEYYVTNQRDQAFLKTIETNYPDIEVVAKQGIADPAQAESQASGVITRNPDLAGAYATFSQPVGEGVLSALRSNSSDAKLVSLDLDEPLALDMAKDGNTAALVADLAYDLGKALADSAAYGILGKDAPPFVVAPAVTVTRANLVDGYRESLQDKPSSDVAEALG